MITIQKAVLAEAELLTKMMKKTFEEEAKKWLLNKDITDYNIQPPGYTSVEMTKYMMEELTYFKIMIKQCKFKKIQHTLSSNRKTH